MTDKVLIFGRGFLGTRLANDIANSHLSHIDITNTLDVQQEITTHRPTVIINAAGKTGKPNVDWCEYNQFETYCSNVKGPLVLAKVCAEADLYLLHLASGCIFYGESPFPGGWRENDFANPIAFYSRTKYAADLILSTLPNVGIARLRMPIDDKPSARNLITKLAAYKQVIDVENSVTIVSDLVDVVRGLLQRRAEGIFHVTNSGSMHHTELLALYRKIVDPTHTYELIQEDRLVGRGLAVKPRSNCLLSSTRLDEIGLTMRPIKAALEETLTRYAKYTSNGAEDSTSHLCESRSKS